MPNYPIFIETFGNESHWYDVSASVSGDAIVAVSGIIDNGYTFLSERDSRDIFVHIPPIDIRRVTAYLN